MPRSKAVSLNTAKFFDVLKLELQTGHRYILFIDSNNLVYESARDLSRLMADKGFLVSIVLTRGEPHISVVDDGDFDLPEGSVKVEEENEQP